MSLPISQIQPRFTEAVNRALSRACQSASHYVGTEDVLLAIAEDKTSLAGIILRDYKVTPQKLRKSIERKLGRERKKKHEG